MKSSFHIVAVLAALLVSCQGNKAGESWSTEKYMLSLGEYKMVHLGFASATNTVIPLGQDEKILVVSGVKSASEVTVSGNAASPKIDASANTLTFIRGGKAKFTGSAVEITPSFNGTASDAALAVGQVKPDASYVVMSPLYAVLRFTVTNPQTRKVSFSVSDAIFPSKCTYDPAKKAGTVTVRKQSVTISIGGSGEFYVPVNPGFSAVNLTLEWKDANGEVLGIRKGVLEWDCVVGSMLNIGSLESVSLGDSDIPLPDPSIPQAEQATIAVQRMGVGLNITGLEHCWETLINKPQRDNPTYYETAGGYGLITANTMKAIADAGFKTVRVPVTWHLHMDNVSDSAIDKVWLDRVEQVVDYALDAGLYVIINMHHDAGTRIGRWCISDLDHYEQTSAGINNIWTQIATRFKDKDYRLLFEGFNEILDGDNTWTYPKQELSLAVANQLAQEFVYTVRRTGGMNSTRNLIINTYAATATEGAVSKFRMPKDISAGHLMVEFHSYVPTAFCSQQDDGRNNLIEDDFNVMEDMFLPIQKYLLDNDYPCILGEFGSYQKEGRSEEDRATHAGFMTKLALEKRVVPIIWYSPMSGSERTEVVKWSSPAVRDAMVNAYNDFISGQ